MGDWALTRGGILYRTAGITTSGGTQMTSVTSGGSSNTQGSATELHAAIDIEVGGFWVHYWGDTSDGTRNAIQIFIGDVGSEVALTSEMLLDTGGAPASKRNGCFFVPLGIPLGARISVKHRASGVSKIIRVGLTLRGISPMLPPPFGRMTAYGFSTSTTNGTAVIENASANTKGSAFDLTASTSRPCKALMLYLFGGGAVATEQRWTYDILAGGVIVIPDIPTVMAPSIDALTSPHFGPFEVDLPSGIALSMQCQTDTGSSPNNSAVLYGLD